MKRVITLIVVLFGIPLLFAGAFFAELAAIWEAGGAFDDDVRRQHALPAAWPLYAAILLVAICAASALWPWGFAS